MLRACRCVEVGCAGGSGDRFDLHSSDSSTKNDNNTNTNNTNTNTNVGGDCASEGDDGDDDDEDDGRTEDGDAACSSLRVRPTGDCSTTGAIRRGGRRCDDGRRSGGGPGTAPPGARWRTPRGTRSRRKQEARQQRAAVNGDTATRRGEARRRCRRARAPTSTHTNTSSRRRPKLAWVAVSRVV